MAELHLELDNLAKDFLSCLRPGYVLQTVHYGSSVELMCFDDSGKRVHSGNVFSLMGPLQVVEHQLRGGTQGGILVTESRLLPSGEFDFQFSFELAGLSPAKVVIDETFRYPGHPRPVPPAPAEVRGADPTDPVVLATVQGLIAEFCGLYAKLKGQPPEFGDGYSEEQIAHAEARLGVRLPDDLRAVYRTVHSDPDVGLLGQFCPLPLEKLVDTQAFSDGLFDVAPVVLESVPARHVRRLSRNDRWITFATDFAMTYCAVDLDPAELGTVGQLIVHGRDWHGAVGYLADSVSAQLTAAVQSLRAGGWQADPHSSRIWPPDSFPRAARAAAAWSVTVGDQDLAGLVPVVDDPLAVQEVYLNDASNMDLAGLESLSNLRQISVNRASVVTGSPPAGLPVEWLSLHASTIDDTVLAGHGTIWNLTVRGRTPVAIESLQSFPALAKLDLSNSDTVGMRQNLQTLENLKVLTLNNAQWQQIRESGTAIPPLAAAELSGYASLATALDWARWIRGRSQ